MKKRTGVILSIMTMLAIISVPAGYVQATQNNWDNVIFPGVYIDDVDVSGKDFREAKKIIEEIYEVPIGSRKIEITANNKIYSIDFNSLKAEYNIDDTIAAAFSYGKEKSFISRYMLIKTAEKKAFRLKLNYDSKPLEAIIDKIEKEVYKKPTDAKVTAVNGKISIIPEIDGVSLQKDKLKEEIISKIENESAVEAIKLEAPIEILRPVHTEEMLSSVNSKISSFSTNFKTSTANRINNIELATKAIDGTILLPGESFSFNEIVGKRTKERGYKEAGVIIGDQIESGLGGGICQVSSTLYNAMLRTSVASIERRNHSLPLAYVSKGLDATVDWGNIDYKFKNTLDQPIYIEGYILNKNVYFNVYSNEKFTRKTYEMVTEVTEVIEPKVKYTDDPNMYEGEEKVLKKPSPGYKVKVYRKAYEDGKLMGTTLISTDTYKVVNGETSRGTKKMWQRDGSLAT